MSDPKLVSREWDRSSWVETGESRKPIMGETWLNKAGHVYTGDPVNVGARRILRRALDFRNIDPPKVEESERVFGESHYFET